MEKTAWIITFKLKKGVKQEDFVNATKQVHDTVISKAKGFLSWEQYLQDDTWVDFVLWESLEDAKNATTVGQGKQETKNFYALIQCNTCKMLISPLVKKYE